MRYLLDTHVLLWAWLEPQRVPRSFKDAAEDTANELIASAASLWEIAIKQAAGKLKLPGPAVDWVPQALDRFGLEVLAITGPHVLAAAALPAIHRDPFDRVLVAQARQDGFTLVTADPLLGRYDVPVLTI